MPNVNSRFRPLERPQAAPGSCLTCLGTTGPFVDTGISIDFAGAVILCIGCVTEMARQLEITEKVEVILDEDEILQRTTEAWNIGEQVGRHSALEAIRVFVDSNHASLTPISDASLLDPVKGSEGVEIVVPKSGRGKSGATTGSVEGDGTLSEPGRSDVSGNSSNGFSLAGISID